MAAVADPLALPPVPAPAPDRHRAYDRLVAIAFVVALLLPALGVALLPARETMRFENRRPDPWPSGRPWPWRPFAAEFERAFGDRFGGRDALIALHHGTKSLVFGVSPVRNVMLARDGWLYWLGEDGRSLDRHYRGIVPFPDERVHALVAELERRRAWLASKGIPYVVTIVPEKFTIYPEHLPSWVRRTERTPLDRAIDAIRRDDALRFVDLRPALREAKARDQLYYRTDSHWNVLGALVGYDAIMRAVVDALPPDRRPATIVPAARPPYVPGVDRYAGDLLHFIALSRVLSEEDFAPIAKVNGDADRRCAKRVDANLPNAADAQPERYLCAGSRGPKLMMLRDSMAIPMIPFLAENFRESLFLTTRRLDPALVLAERPDIVVEEMVERAIDVPEVAPMPPPPS